MGEGGLEESMEGGERAWGAERVAADGEVEVGEDEREGVESRLRKEGGAD